MICGCESCAAARGDEPAPTYTRDHRMACEVRYALARPLQQRRDYLDLVERSRGLAARRALEAAIVAAWHAKKNPAPHG